MYVFTLVQSSLSWVEQYIGRWPMIMIQGLFALFSGLAAFCAVYIIFLLKKVAKWFGWT